MTLVENRGAAAPSQGMGSSVRLMTLNTLFLIHRYKAVSVHYVSPTEDNQHQAAGMRELGIYESIQTEVGQIIVAQVNAERVRALVKPDGEELRKLIAKNL